LLAEEEEVVLEIHRLEAQEQAVEELAQVRMQIVPLAVWRSPAYLIREVGEAERLDLNLALILAQVVQEL
jgi:hypothetical protein